MKPKRRSLWGTRFGFYLAAIGSAFGLGNIWRFPYVTVENGGGAFVLLYVFFALLIGLPMLIGELMLGKLSRRSVILAAESLPVLSGRSAAEVLDLSPLDSSVVADQGSGPGTSQNTRQNTDHRSKKSRMIWVGGFAVLACLLILSYYALISGWVLHFLMQFFFGHLVSGSYDAEASLRVLRESGLLQIALTSVHLLIGVIIVAKGVQEGMEKWVSHLMPIFVVLLVILVTKSLSLPTAVEAMRFMFYPDFSALTPYSMLQALGHVFFTLSIGFGTMVTFGSYLNDHTHIPSAGFRVTAMDTIISLFAGLLIFPLLIGSTLPSPGPELVFQALPRLLAGLDNGFLFGMAFFVCLYLAALGASIGLLECLVANVSELTGFSRSRAAWVTGAIAFCLALVPSLSTSVLGQLHYRGDGLLVILDTLIITVILPLAALGVAIAISARLRPEAMEAEFVNDDSIATKKLYSHWRFMLKWVVPGVIVISFLVAIVGFALSRSQ